ncbi:T9SS type A sorting domain-containing protein [Mariniflexile sp. HNIBRBA6329]|uniref:T9SS type A sorting domain-containing protein n=1 Tax=Mariniflexile sp. HNIBRBA6329 TaxID=3373088 RepID=UPI003745ADB9
MKTTLLKNFLTLCVLVFSVGAINAQIWVGGTSTDFLDASNWNDAVLPDASDDVIIDPSSNNPILNASLSSAGNADDFVSHLTISPDGDLTVAAKLWIWSSGGNFFGSGTLNVEDGADINIRNQGRFGTSAGNHQIVNVNGGLVNTKNQLIIGDAGDCTFNINGGTVTSTLNGIILGGYAGVGILNLNGGVLKVNGGFPIDEQPSRAGTGYMTIDNGTLELTGDQVSFVEGYVAAGKIVAAPGKEIVITYDAFTIDVTYVTAVAATPKNVLYLNQIGVGQGAGASAPGADPVIRMLQGDANFNVTYIESDQTGTQIPDLSGFDLVIAQESFSSGAAVFKPGGKLGLKDVTIPIIYNKSYAFRNTRAVTDADASVPNGQTEVDVTVDPTNQSNILFRGISFAGGNTVPIFASATANDDGSVGGTKAIDAVINLDITVGGGSLATTSITTDPATSMVINFLPSGTGLGTSGTDVLTVDAVALSFSYGATILGDGTNVTSEALTIWRNAAYILTGLPVPNSLFVNPDLGTLSLDKNTSTVSTDVRAIGNRIYVSNVKSTSEINIYSITGALVKSFKTNEDTNFSFQSGLYIATIKTFEGAKSVKLLMK